MTARDAKRLYPDLLLDHGRAPRNEGPLAGATHEATKTNPLCGDRVTVRARVDEDELRELRFEARGCLLARASASILTDLVRGRSVAEALDLVLAIEALVGTPDGPPAAQLEDERVRALRGVYAFPERASCVLLAWAALATALGRR